MALGCTVVSTVPHLKSSVRSFTALVGNSQACGQQELQLVRPRLRQWPRSERSCGISCWNNFAPARPIEMAYVVLDRRDIAKDLGWKRLGCAAALD
jgi:hypothetical protein